MIIYKCDLCGKETKNNKYHLDEIVCPDSSVSLKQNGEACDDCRVAIYQLIQKLKERKNHAE